MNRRIAGYDFARSVALFGLVAANFSDYGEPSGFFLLYTLSQGGVTTTFLVLAGIGMSLLRQRDQSTSSEHKSADSRRRLTKRAAFLLVVGICCNVIWQTYFLCFYSICIGIGALLLTTSNRWLWSLAFIFIFIWAAFTFWIGYSDVIRNFEALQDSDPWTVEGTTFRLFRYGFLSIFFWTGSLLLGMWLGRWKVHYLRVRSDLFFGGIVVALFSVGIPRLLTQYIPISVWDSPVWDSPGGTLSWLFVPISMPLHFFGICGIVTAIIGGSLMLTEKYPAAKWTKPFIATGQLALTLYVAHLVIGKELLKALGLFWFPIESAVIFCICAVIFSHFWRKGFERGPIEWALRRVTG